MQVGSKEASEAAPERGPPFLCPQQLVPCTHDMVLCHPGAPPLGLCCCVSPPSVQPPEHSGCVTLRLSADTRAHRPEQMFGGWTGGGVG